MITKEQILTHKSEEDLFYMYMKIYPKKGRLYKSPLREDKHPTCAFYRGSKGLYFKDFALDKSYNIIDVVMELYNLSYYKALKKIASDIGLIDQKDGAPIIYLNKHSPVIDKITETESCTIEVEIKEFSESEIEYWKQYNIDLELLKLFNVYSIKKVFLNGILHSSSSKNNPIFGYYFGKHKITKKDLWKLYFPNKTKYRFLLNNNIVQGIHQIKDVYSDYIVITKSYKDVISMRSFGIYAIAPQSESVVLNQKLVDYLKSHFKLLIWNGDWDRTGKSFMINNRKKYGGICLTFKDRNVFKKDFSDNVAYLGVKKINKLINFLQKRLQ